MAEAAGTPDDRARDAPWGAAGAYVDQQRVWRPVAPGGAATPNPNPNPNPNPIPNPTPNPNPSPNPNPNLRRGGTPAR